MVWRHLLKGGKKNKKEVIGEISIVKKKLR
jgi:hypothetical protein